LSLHPVEYFGKIQPLLSTDDQIEIALGVDGVAKQLNIGDLPPDPRRDLGTYVVTVFANSR
jgi:hypothetical protein